jgi:hypothetical protein
LKLGLKVLLMCVHGWSMKQKNVADLVEAGVLKVARPKASVTGVVKKQELCIFLFTTHIFTLTLVTLLLFSHISWTYIWRFLRAVPKYGSWLANYCCYGCMKTHDNSHCTLYIQTWQSLPVSYNIIGVRIDCNAVHEYWIQLCNATVKSDVWHNAWTVSYCKISFSSL